MLRLLNVLLKFAIYVSIKSYIHIFVSNFIEIDTCILGVIFKFDRIRYLLIPTYIIVGRITDNNQARRSFPDTRMTFCIRVL